MNAVILTVFMISLPAFGLDAIRIPPERREFFSLNTRFTLIISTTDKWRSGIAKAALYQTDKGLRKQLWSQQLPYSFGPRYVLLHNSGTSVLIDEWMNVKSDHAVHIIDSTGGVVASHSYVDMCNILGVSKRELMDRAESGWWVAGSPFLSFDSEYVHVPAGRKILRIRITDGELSASKILKSLAQ